ncbi:hypothetical protein F183_A21340 [Bryobacterales bacterium F-183]|nr:hypothetical protein F183_A21340 [Bryobacterales bacterium F-183]
MFYLAIGTNNRVPHLVSNLTHAVEDYVHLVIVFARLHGRFAKFNNAINLFQSGNRGVCQIVWAYGAAWFVGEEQAVLHHLCVAQALVDLDNEL